MFFFRLLPALGPQSKTLSTPPPVFSPKRFRRFAGQELLGPGVGCRGIHPPQARGRTGGRRVRHP